MNALAAPTKIKLARKSFIIPELVFKKLRLLCSAYGLLAQTDATIAQQGDALNQILFALVGKPINYQRVSEAEWQSLFLAIPGLCGLENSATKGNASATDWGEVYAHLSACFGWDYDYIDNHMTLSRLKEYGEYLKQNPPLHQIAAAYCGLAHKEINEEAAFFKGMAKQARLTVDTKTQGEA